MVKTAAPHNIRTHLQDGARKCRSYPTLEKVLKVFCSRYGLPIREAKTHLSLTNLRRDTKFSLTDHATEVKTLVEAA